ncbi:MAG: hypothetical protein KJS83_12010, partial [Xanthomonadaceae bacterium]|nr:hypothetical protein [Xanthomonadaceae bacterium]
QRSSLTAKSKTAVPGRFPQKSASISRHAVTDSSVQKQDAQLAGNPKQHKRPRTYAGLFCGRATPLQFVIPEAVSASWRGNPTALARLPT